MNRFNKVIPYLLILSGIAHWIENLLMPYLEGRPMEVPAAVFGFIYFIAGILILRNIRAGYWLTIIFNSLGGIAAITLLSEAFYPALTLVFIVIDVMAVIYAVAFLVTNQVPYEADPVYNLENTPKRFLGLDFYRFFGLFLVISFHFGYTSRRPLTPGQIPDEATSAWPFFFDLIPLMEEHGPSVLFVSPYYWMVFIILFVAVPVFFVLSGMFAFSGKDKNNQWSISIKRAWTLFRFYIFISLISLIFGWVLNGGPAISFPLDFLETMTPPVYDPELEIVLRNKGIYMPDLNHLWYTWVLIGLTLLVPIFKPIFNEKNVMTMRYFMALGFLAAYVFPALNHVVATYFQHSTVALSLFRYQSLFDLNGYFTPFLLFFFFGAWVKNDPWIAERLLRISYPKYALAIVMSVLLTFAGLVSIFPSYVDNAMITVGNYPVTASYFMIALVPFIYYVFGFFYKLSWIISIDGSLGRFITRYAKYTGRGYFIHFFLIGLVVFVFNLLVPAVPLEALGNPAELATQVMSHEGMVSGYNAAVYNFRMNYMYGLPQFFIYFAISFGLLLMTLLVSYVIDFIPGLKKLI